VKPLVAKLEAVVAMRHSMLGSRGAVHMCRDTVTLAAVDAYEVFSNPPMTG
jgi:hypothetical protein